MVRLLVAAVNWHKSLQFAKKPNITLLPCLFIKAQVALLPKPKIRQPKNFRKVETATGRANKCDTIFESPYRNIHKYVKINTVYQIFEFWRVLCGNKHKPKLGILVCFCPSTSTNYRHANVSLFILYQRYT